MEIQKKIQIYPSITHIKYNEPKFMTYLVILIIMGLVFVSSVISLGFDYSRRLDRIEKHFSTLQDTISKEVISELKFISSYIEAEKSTLISLLNIDGIDLQKGIELENEVSTKETEM